MNNYKFKMVLNSGAYADLNDIPNMFFTWRDIAESLGKLCRFNGHCNTFYSVAQHCFHVSRLLDDAHKHAAHNVEIRLYGLLHDAHESFIGDMIQPLKSLKLPVWQNLSTGEPIRISLKELLISVVDQLDQRIHEEADLRYPLSNYAKRWVKHCDLVMLSTEKIAIMNVDLQDNWYDEKLNLLPDHDPAMLPLPAMDWKMASDAWLSELSDLMWKKGKL